MSDVRVYVNGRGLDVAASATAGDAVATFDAALGAAVVRGDSRITDSRGLDVDPAVATYGGAIYRVVARRSSREDGTVS